jgi:hypothetical protein
MVHVILGTTAKILKSAGHLRTATKLPIFHLKDK